MAKSLKVAKTYYGSRYGPGGRSSNAGLTATVFGSSGFIGRYLLTELGAAGTRVYAPFRGDEMDVRHLKPMFDLGQLGLMPFSARDDQSIIESIQNSDVVVNLIGKHYETKHPLPLRRPDGKLSRVNYSFDEVHVAIPTKIAQLCKAADVKKFIHVSSLSADAASKCAWSASKARGEESVLAEFPSAVIVKLSTVFGAEDRFLNPIAECMKKLPFFPLLNGGSNLVQPVYVNDVALGLHQIIKNYDSVQGKTFQFTGNAEYTYKEVAEFVQDVILVKKPLVDVPVSVAKTVGRFTENLISPIWTEDYVEQILENVVEKPLVEGEAEAENILTLRDLLSTELGSLDRLAFDYLHRYRKGGHFTLIKGYHSG